MIASNSPRNSRHKIIYFKQYPHLYIPERILQKVWRPMEGVRLIEPLLAKYDLIHSFNAIPYTNKPWIITFESILPRSIGFARDKLTSIIIDRLARDNCRKIIAMSNYAKQKFLKTNERWHGIKIAGSKLDVIHPSFPIKIREAKKYRKGTNLELLFVGNDFARKGGVVILKVAEKAKKMKLPIKISIVSGMNYGSQVYTDCLDTSKYQKYLPLLNLDNVVFYKKLPNQEVLSLLSKNHFQVMCTLDDTYGYSVLEGFSVGTPSITTNVCALPEFVNSTNGLVINLELNKYRNWVHLATREESDYWPILENTYDALCDQVLRFLLQILDNPESYEQLSAGALAYAKAHDSDNANEVFDNLYAKLI